MKSLPIILSVLTSPARRRNLLSLGKLLVAFVVIVAVFAVIFQHLMDLEGQRHSWTTAVYWVLVVMSTLGFGDITFHSDAGRFFSIVVLLTGSSFMLVLLPFMFIQFFYVPWMEAQAAARAPRELSRKSSGHVILTGLGPIEQSLIGMLRRARIPYVLLTSDLNEALKLHDEGYSVMLGEIDDPGSYVRARADQASLVVATQRDTTNTNITFTVREISSSVAIIATASFAASVDILELAGCNRVLRLDEMLGQALARRILGRDAKCHVVGGFGELLIAEASAAGTPLVGRTLKHIRLGEHAPVNVVGVWKRGRFELAGPDTLVDEKSILLLSGTRDDLDQYDGLFCLYGLPEAHVLIIGGGRVGRAVAKELEIKGIDYRIVERQPSSVLVAERTITGDAAELGVLEQAGIMSCSSVVITTHDDDINIYLAIYCRRLRPDIQILARSNQDRNVSTLHRAGADYVMSYASTGANSAFNLLQQDSLLMLAQGLDVFLAPVPPELVGRTLAESHFRQRTGCSVIAIEHLNTWNAHPAPDSVLRAADQLLLVGDAQSEQRFAAKWSYGQASAPDVNQEEATPSRGEQS